MSNFFFIQILMHYGYLRNIKRHCYKRTNNERQLKSYLHETENHINVFIFGHSCGLSDKLILSEIMNHPNICTINILYYETADNYFDSHINLYRIMRDDNNYDKIVNFQDSCRMPQMDKISERITEAKVWLSDVAPTIIP